MDILDRITMLLGNREQQELTEFLRLKKTAYTDWKSGKSKSYRKYLIEIAEFFNVSIDYLVYGKDAQTTIQLTADQQELLEKYKKLSEREQGRILERIDQMLETIEKDTSKDEDTAPRSDRVIQTAALEPKRDFA